MKTTKATLKGIKVTAGIKAGGIPMPGCNHNTSMIKVRSGIKGGQTTILPNHNTSVIKVRSGIKGGQATLLSNHNVQLVVRT
jgi:hypothetical protein